MYKINVVSATQVDIDIETFFSSIYATHASRCNCYVNKKKLIYIVLKPKGSELYSID